MRTLRVSLLVACAVGVVLNLPARAFAADDIETLRRQVKAQQAQIEQQRAQLAEQAQALARIETRLAELARVPGPAAPALSPLPPAPTPKTPMPSAPRRADEAPGRDAVGDLNTRSVVAGSFPGSIRLPGPENVSIDLGGFVKCVAIADSDAQGMGADFLPATLGTRGRDESGAFSIDATITRLFLDGRSPAGGGMLKGYVEADFNAGNDGALGLKLRQAYGEWDVGEGTLTFGHTWSTLMDLNVLPEGLTEPTVSGAIFMRQPLIRWTQRMGRCWRAHVAIEDPSSADVFGDRPAIGRTAFPDVVAGVDGRFGRAVKLRLNGVLRRLETEDVNGRREGGTGWGVALTGRWDISARDSLCLGGAVGDGLGRYLLGIQSTDGSALDPSTGAIDPRRNWGAFGAYQHQWCDTLRSTLMVGHAEADPLDWQPDGTLRGTTYVGANLIWQLLPQLSLGLEYDFGVREDRGGKDWRNHRVMFGFQLY